MAGSVWRTLYRWRLVIVRGLRFSDRECGEIDDADVFELLSFSCSIPVRTESPSAFLRELLTISERRTKYFIFALFLQL